MSPQEGVPNPGPLPAESVTVSFLSSAISTSNQELTTEVPTSWAVHHIASLTDHNTRSYVQELSTFCREGI